MNDRRAAAQSGIWSIVLQWSRFGLNTLIFLILARWLSLSEIGLFAVAHAPVSLLQIVQRGGFSETVIQGESDNAPFLDTIFWMSVVFGGVVAAALLGVSFLIGPVMGAADAGAFLAAMAAIPLLIGIAAVPEGLLRRRMEVRTLALRTTVSLLVAGGIAIWLGAEGFGGWALTAFVITNALVSTVLVMLLARWTPTGGPRSGEARNILPVLGAIMGRGLVANATMPVLQMLVGVTLGAAAAGTLQVAQRFLDLASTATLTPLRFAVLPVFVRVRDDPDRLGRVVTETAGFIGVVSAPVYFGLLAVAPALLPLAVGEANGTAAVPVLQALLLTGGTIGLFTIFAMACTAIGQARVALMWSALMFVLNMVIAAVTLQYSITVVALGYASLGYAAVPSLLKLLSRQVRVTPWTTFTTVFGPVAAAAVMALTVMVFDRHVGQDMSAVSRLGSGIALGGGVYVALALILMPSRIVSMKKLLHAIASARMKP